ncbi:hypothetical protein FQN49_005973 [Arthroderma sp. PD_2]|nr:hypothetical protein FQN49_005973 [Arthroderma sp. PD_2]
MSPSGGANRATPKCVVSSKLLIGLPEGTPQIEYTNMKTLESVIDAQCRRCDIDDCQSPFLIVTCIPPAFPEDFSFDIGRRFTADLEEKLAVIETMTKLSHGMMAYQLMLFIQHQIDSMGLGDEVLGTSPFQVKSTTGQWVKEGDGGFVRANDQKWPIVAIEIGLFESESKLAIDAQGWLEIDGSKTKIVLTAKLNRRRPQITFQRWEHHLPSYRPITRHFHPTGSAVEEVVATHEGGVTRVNGNITIPFEKLFGRARRGPNERDVVVDRVAFTQMCERAWRAQEFM